MHRRKENQVHKNPLYKKFKNIDKKDLLEILDVVEKELKKSIIPYIRLLEKEITGEKDSGIVNTIVFNRIAFKSDRELFRFLEKKILDYEKHIPDLRAKIEEEMPTTIPLGSPNPNIKIVLSLVGMGLFFIDTLPIILVYIIDKFYIKTKFVSEFNEAIKKSGAAHFNMFINLVNELENVKFGIVINVIGKLPNFDYRIKSLREKNTFSEKDYVEENKIPVTLVTGFLRTELKIKSESVIRFIKEMLKIDDLRRVKLNHLYKRHRSNIRKDYDEFKTSFIGNPIYHIRLYLVDLKINKLQKLKNEKKLLELKLAQLRAEQQGNPNPKLNEQIEYYEKQIMKYEDKIKAIMEE